MFNDEHLVVKMEHTSMFNRFRCHVMHLLIQGGAVPVGDLWIKYLKHKPLVLC